MKKGLEAYEKINHTLCLNSGGATEKKEDGTIVQGNILFNIDKDYHIDCNDNDEMIDCLETIESVLTEADKNAQIIAILKKYFNFTFCDEFNKICIQAKTDKGSYDTIARGYLKSKKKYNLMKEILK